MAIFDGLTAAPLWFWVLGYALCGVAFGAWFLWENSLNETLQTRMERLADVAHVWPQSILKFMVIGFVIGWPVLLITVLIVGVPPRVYEPEDEDQ